MRLTHWVLVAVGFIAFLSSPLTIKADDLYAKIQGIVTDQSGAVLPDVTVTATNTATGVSKQVTSGQDGSYVFLQLPIGNYTLNASKAGFEAYTAANIHLDVNQVFKQNIQMAIGAVTTEVTVQANQVQVETSTPQLGVVVDSNQIVNMPLIGRNFVNLQALEPGVVGGSDRFNTNYDFATNGAQSQMNAYLIDGTDTGDIAVNTTTFIPSPDAISEFRMVTSTLNPEYARSSGAVMNAVIKSGTNSFHGDAFDFYRDTFLDAANYFAVPHVPSPYQQNQFGGTIGGPIVKNHTFFFFSYEGIRATEPQTNPVGPNVVTNVYTDAERNGAFGPGAFATSTNSSPFPLWGDPCPPAGAKCPAGTPFSSLFASGNIPTQDFNSISQVLLAKYIPHANFGSNQFSFNASQPTKDNQFLVRIDHNFGAKDTLWGTWFIESYPVSDTVPFVGATLPGFGMTEQQHYKFVSLSYTHIFNDHMINEIRGGYNRFNFASVFPANPTLPSTAGFAIDPQLTSGAGLPVENVTGFFNLGFSSDGPQPRIDQVYQAVDNLTMVEGRHTFKVGFDMRRWEVFNPFSFSNDGTYNFSASGVYSTGNPGADFLLGIPASYYQGSGAQQSDRARQYYTYAQDQFKFRPNLTLIYGFGWSIDTPMINEAFHNHAQVAFRPGQQSNIYPNAPIGVVYQGDPGVSAAGEVHIFKNIGPRVGLAYSPDWGGRLTGGPGKTSLRAGFGLYYDRSEQEQALQVAGLPPFAITYSEGEAPGGFNPSFANPFVDVATGAKLANPFPFSGYPSNVNFATTPGLEPVFSACCAVLDAHTQDPMSENYNLTLERQVSSSAILSLGYVGSESHYLTYGVPLNTINAGGLPKYPIAVYGSIDSIYSGANGNYNAFQASLNQHLSHGLQYLISYTYSHSIDEASGFENSTFGEVGAGSAGFGGFGAIRASNPYCFPGCDRASSIYDARQRLVVSYFYELPGLRGKWMLSRLTQGWTIAGITTFQTGFPLDVADLSFPSGGYAPISGVSDFTSWEGPNQAGPVSYLNPRGKAHMWFNPNAFTQVSCAPSCSNPSVPSSYGNAPRNPLRGPGINNWDFQLFKDTAITESTKIEFRIEFYNLFNHTQFNPEGVITDISNPNFGEETEANDPRRTQLAVKFYF